MVKIHMSGILSWMVAILINIYLAGYHSQSEYCIASCQDFDSSLENLECAQRLADDTSDLILRDHLFLELTRQLLLQQKTESAIETSSKIQGQGERINSTLLIARTLARSGRVNDAVKLLEAAHEPTILTEPDQKRHKLAYATHLAMIGLPELAKEQFAEIGVDRLPLCIIEPTVRHTALIQFVRGKLNYSSPEPELCAAINQMCYRGEINEIEKFCNRASENRWRIATAQMILRCSENEDLAISIQLLGLQESYPILNSIIEPQLFGIPISSFQDGAEQIDDEMDISLPQVDELARLRGRSIKIAVNALRTRSKASLEDLDSLISELLILNARYMKQTLDRRSFLTKSSQVRRLLLDLCCVQVSTGEFDRLANIWKDVGLAGKSQLTELMRLGFIVARLVKDVPSLSASHFTSAQSAAFFIGAGSVSLDPESDRNRCLEYLESGNVIYEHFRHRKLSDFLKEMIKDYVHSRPIEELKFLFEYLCYADNSDEKLLAFFENAPDEAFDADSLRQCLKSINPAIQLYACRQLLKMSELDDFARMQAICIQLQLHADATIRNAASLLIDRIEKRLTSQLSGSLKK